MPLSPTLPNQRCRAAITARLQNSTNGFNAQLAACFSGAGLTAFTIDFTADSVNYLHGKYNIDQLFEDSEIQLPAISVYQGPAKQASPRDNLVGGVFSGYVAFGLDVHLMSTEGQSQSVFDQQVSAVADAVINSFNMTGVNDYSTRQLVWNGDVSMGQPSRILDPDTGQYLSTLPFRLSFYCPQ
jgi:hypothetical protein